MSARSHAWSRPFSRSRALVPRRATTTTTTAKDGDEERSPILSRVSPSAIRNFLSALSLSSSSSSSSSSSQPRSTDSNGDEAAYLDLMQAILAKGSLERTRTGIPTKTLFGEMLKFDLRGNKLPLITTKRVSYYNVLHELLWFMSGSTDLQDLARRRVYIWHANATKEYLDSVGLSSRYEPFGDLGPIYSHQWRHYGAKYVDCYANYNGKGVDQLREVLRQLRHDRTSRRIILLSWNPTQTSECVLPPCHCMAQFRVLNGNQLHCHLTQRSADYALGLPYNIASYATLTHILARLSGLEAAELVVSLGDAHLYEPHWETAKIQLKRAPYSPPKIRISLPVYTPESPLDLAAVTSDCVELVGYAHHPALTYELCP